ncbi:hypothetical protein ABZ383_22630 [Streptomyces sp. NPDC005900]|uniref:hypothetical protein n=1 Tax=Streptomyces sp. NPDC005900 TaxID=3154569 RepID=UPI0033F10F68
MTDPGTTPSESEMVPRWPLYRLTAEPDGTVRISGPAAPSTPLPDRGASVEAVAALTAMLTPPRPVHAEAVDEDGTVWPLLIHPDGTVIEAGPQQRAKGPRRRLRVRQRPQPAPAPHPVGMQSPATGPGSPASPPAADEHLATVARSVIEPEATVEPSPLRKADEAPDPTAPLPIPPSTMRIRALAEAGQLAEALMVATLYDDAAARTHGPSHRAAIEAREIRAHITVENGDLAAGIALYRDAAERWALQGEHVAAGEAAGRAHALWLRITDPAQAITTGEAIVRMRTQIPGPDGAMYRKAARRLDKLKSAAALG